MIDQNAVDDTAIRSAERGTLPQRFGVSRSCVSMYPPVADSAFFALWSMGEVRDDTSKQFQLIYIVKMWRDKMTAKLFERLCILMENISNSQI